MTGMAVGGIVLSLLAPRFTQLPSPARRLQCAFAAAATAAFLTLAPLNLASAVAVSTLIGAGLGLLTVTLVTISANGSATATRSSKSASVRASGTFSATSHRSSRQLRNSSPPPRDFSV